MNTYIIIMKKGRVIDIPGMFNLYKYKSEIKYMSITSLVQTSCFELHSRLAYCLDAVKPFVVVYVWRCFSTSSVCEWKVNENLV